MRRIQVLKGVMLAVLVIVAATITYVYRLHNRLSQAFTPTTMSCAARGPSRQTVSTSDNGYSADAFWNKLVNTYAEEDLVAFGLRAAAPIEVDGQINDASWADSFETAAIDPASRDAVTRPLVRCLWEADTLYIAVDLANAAPGKNSDATAHCQVVLGTSDSAARFRFTIDTKGVQASHRLMFDQCREIPRESWRAVIRPSPQGLSAEFAFTRRSLGLDAFAEGALLPMVVRIARGWADELDTPVTPAYWFLDSLQGFKSRLMLAECRPGQGQTVRFSNGIIEPGQWLLQWSLRRIDVLPGTSLEIPLELSACKPTGMYDAGTGPLEARLVSPSGAASTLEIKHVGQRKAASCGLLRMRVAVPPREVSGLYQVRLLWNEKGGSREVVSWPLWIAKDWSKHARQYLLDKRDSIEKLSIDHCHKSILVAHVTKALTMLTTLCAIDMDFLKTLDDLDKAMKAVAEGKPPRIPTGKSELTVAANDKGTASVKINVPAHYDDSFAWPICCGRTLIPNMINVETGAVSVWAGYSATLQESLRIDASRRYVVGTCEEAYLMMDQLVRRPEPWAAGMLNLRMRWTPMAVNARYVPLLLYAIKPNKGSKSDVDDILIPETGTKWMRLQNCPLENVDHPSQIHRDLLESQLPEAARWLFRHVRKQAPQTVECVCYGYEFASKYWVSIDAIGQQRRLATLKATINADSVTVQTNGNVLGYSLHLDRAPLPAEVKTLAIIEDNQQVGEVTLGQGSPRFRRLPKDADGGASLRKQPGKGGSIGFTLANLGFEIVTGASSNDPRRIKAMQALAGRLSSIKKMRIGTSTVSDVVCDEQRMRSGNMILLGSPRDNAWIRRMAERTPIRLEPDGMRMGGRSFAGEKLGLIALYPNPLNNDRFILFVTSSDTSVLEQLVKTLEAKNRVVTDSDCVVVEPAPDNKHLTILYADHFDWQWKPIIGDRTIATLKRTHPDWQWTNLLGEIIRQRTGVETFFAHQLLRFSPAGVSGPINDHDLYQYFFNDWVALTNLSSSKLKARMGKLLTDFPQATASGMFHPVSGAFRLDIQPSDKAAGKAEPLVSVATVVPEDEVALEAPGYTYDHSYIGAPVSLYRHGKTCELTTLYTVDCLVDFLREHPEIDLDDLLDKQPKPIPKDRIKVLDVLDKDVGL